jgi:hypothetical protein
MQKPVEVIGRAVLLILGAALITTLLGTILMFDAQKVVRAMAASRFEDPVSQSAYAFRTLGAVDDFLVAPVICVCVGVFVGLLAKGGPQITAIFSIVWLLYFRFITDYGQDRVFLIFLAIVYLTLAVVSSHFASTYGQRLQETESGTKRGRKKTRRIARA